MRILRPFAISVLCLGLWAISLNAQGQDQGFEIESFRSLAQRAEEVVNAGQASTDALEQLRIDLSAARSSALEDQEARARRVENVRSQIETLGAAPSEGTEEAPEVAARRQELDGDLAEAQAPLIVAQEAYQRADGLISEIDEIIRTRQTNALLEIGPSPLNPELWPAAATGLFDYTSDIFGEFGDNYSSSASRSVRVQNAPIILLLLAVGLALLVPVWRWFDRHFRRYSHSEKPQRKPLRNLGLSVGLFVAPFLGLMALYSAIDLSDLLGLRGRFLIESLPLVGACLFGFYWLGQNIFSQNSLFSKALEVDSNTFLTTKRLVLCIGLLQALWYLLQSVSQGAQWVQEISVVLKFPLILLAGLMLVQLGRRMQRLRQKMLEDPENSAAADRIVTLLTWLCLAAGLFGPLLAAIGYINAGATLVFATIQSLGLSAALLVGYQLVSGVFAPPLVSDQEETTRSSGGLIRVGLGFVAICAAVPLLALIWGARVSDLNGIWLAMREGVSVGETRISISDFLTFVVVFFIGYSITRMLQSALRTTVLPNTRLDSGAQNALITGLGYIGIFLSALIAITTTGLDLSNLAIVAGALSVGIGFGLQAIVSNFVSGIILLIERPIKLGDWVDVGGHSGYVKGISVRSTSIETFDRATVIVPNADLIAGSVTNWTHSSAQGRIRVPVGVAYDSDPEEVKEILMEIASNHPMVLKKSGPWVMFMGFGADSMDFEVRAILRDINWGLTVTSEINFEIVKRFRAAGIEIPFAQREVTIKNPQALRSSD